MEKIDFRKELKNQYNPPLDKVTIAEIPGAKFLMIEGTGDPNSGPDFHQAVEALYSVAFALKFYMKSVGSLEYDYVIPPLEALWWCDNMKFFMTENKTDWKWQLMIRQPAFVTDQHLREAISQTEKKKDLPLLKKIRMERFSEGSVAQIMHIGPYAEEEPNIKKLHGFIEENGFELSGRHHEIYLSDPRKTSQQKLKTILRHPFLRKD